MDDNTSTPDEFVKLRDQLALDLGAIVTVPIESTRSAEYLLASGLVPLSTIRARYDETHPAPEGEGAEPEPEVAKAPVTIGLGDDMSAIPVGAVYLDNDSSTSQWRVRKTESGWEWQNARHGGDGFISGIPNSAYYPLTLESAE